MDQVVGGTPVEEVKKGVFSVNSVEIGSFIGGPFVGFWLLGENFKELGKPELAKQYKIGGVVAFIALIALSYFLDYLAPSSTNTGLGFLSPVLAYVFFNSYQKKEVDAYIKNGGKKRLLWPAVCIIFTVVLYVVVTLLIFSTFWLDSKIKENDIRVENGTNAIELFNQQKYPEALAQLQKNIDLNPKDSESYLYRGMVENEMGDYDNAAKDISLALANKGSDKIDRMAYGLLGEIYDNQEKYAEAIIEYEKALNSKEYPDTIKNSLLYFSEAITYSKMGDIKNALTFLDKTIQSDPNFESAYFLRGMTKIQNKDIIGGCSDLKLEKSINPKIITAIQQAQSNFCK